MVMSTSNFDRLVNAGVSAYGLVVQIGHSIREYATDNDIRMTEQDLADVLIEVHNKVR